jgi:hypothetical protein
MKKSIMLAMTLAVVSNSAFATKARLLALGMDETDNEGSYFIDDNRNIFLNAGNIINHADVAIFEWGAEGAKSNTATTDNTVDTDAAPQAEGGFLKSAGNYVYGAYFGAESNTSALLRVVASSENTSNLLNSSDNQLDLFFGTKLNNINLGADLVYVNNDNDSNKQEDSAMALKVGAVASNWDAFVNLSLDSSSKEEYTTGATHEFDGQFGIHVGGGYEIGNGKVFANLKTFSWDQKDSNPSTAGRKTTVEGSFTSYALGYGHTHEVSSTSKIFTSIEYRMKTIEADFGVAKGTATSGKTEAENTWIPLTFGYEAEATNWLTLRGSVSSNIIGSKDNKNYANLNTVAQGFATQEFGAQGKSTIANSTDVRAGATLNFGKLRVDGVIGAAAATNSAETGVLEFDDLMTRVGVSYNF